MASKKLTLRIKAEDYEYLQSLAKKSSVPLARNLVLQAMAGHGDKNFFLEIMMTELKTILWLGYKVGAGALVAAAMLEANMLSRGRWRKKSNLTQDTPIKWPRIFG